MSKLGYRRLGLPSCLTSLSSGSSLVKQAVVLRPVERSRCLGTEGGVWLSASGHPNPASNHGRELGSMSFPSQALRWPRPWLTP